MKKTLTLILCLIVFVKITIAQSSTLDQVANLSEVLAFFNGQSKSLDRIKNEFPDLKGSATLAELKWDAQFGEVKGEAEKQLRSFLKDHYDEVIAQGYQKFNELFATTNLSRSDAIAFINLVNERAKGNIEKQIRSKVLMYHPDFIEKPELEIAKGFVNEFRSLGSEVKSKGLKIRILYPGSWNETEGVFPNILFKARSKNGKGNILMNVLVKDLSVDKSQYSKNEWDYLVSLEGNKALAESIFAENQLIEALKDLSMQNQKFSEYKRINISGNPAAKITYSGIIQREGVELAMNFTQYNVICKNYMVFITLSCSADSVEKSKKEFDKYFTAFSTIINTVAILNRFE